MGSQLEPIPLLETESKVCLHLRSHQVNCYTLQRVESFQSGPEAFKTQREKQRGLHETSRQRRRPVIAPGVQCAWGRQQLHGANRACVGILTFSFNGPVIPAPPGSLPTIPASLPVLCLCRFPSQIGPQFRTKYSDFPKQGFYMQLIIQVCQTFFKRAFILATKS